MRQSDQCARSVGQKIQRSVPFQLQFQQMIYFQQRQKLRHLPGEGFTSWSIMLNILIHSSKADLISIPFETTSL